MKRCALFLSLLTVSSLANALDGELDTTFGLLSSGRNVVALDRGGLDTDTVVDVLVDAQSRLYLVGTATGANGTSYYAITRLKANGLVDTTFADQGTLYSAASNVHAHRARMDPQGNILVAGSQSFTGQDTDFHICRYTQNGAPVDFAGSVNPGCFRVAFDIGNGNLRDVVNDFTVQDDGAIVLAGVAQISATNERAAIARIDADGFLDTAFSGDGRLTFAPEAGGINHLNAVVQLPSGSLMFAGESGVRLDPGNATCALMARVTPAGALDPNYGIGINDGFDCLQVSTSATGRDDEAVALRALPDGSLFVAGNAMVNRAQGTYIGFVVKLTDFGAVQLDQDFGNLGVQKFFGGYSLTLDDMIAQSDGKLVVVGTRQASNAFVLDMQVSRLTVDGTFEQTEFGPGGRTNINFFLGGGLDYGTAVAMQGGRIVAAGHSLRNGDANFDQTIARLTNDLIFMDGVDH